MNGQDLKQSIWASEGQTMLSEIMSSVASLYLSITNVELAAAFGADLVILNLFDVFSSTIEGYEHVYEESIVKKIKELTGRPIGLNVEPVDLDAEQIVKLDKVSRGRVSTEESLREAKNLGLDFICLTGNPKTGVTNDETVVAIKKARKVFGDEGLIIAGKTHGAGVANETSSIITEDAITGFIEAGANVILMPSPGITLNTIEKYVRTVHSKGALAMLTIGTSQEGAAEATIRQIALNSKMAGTDIYHIGDTGFYGIAVPENIKTYSIAIRGRRHTYVRMATSILR